MRKLTYEKHQRDYTILNASVIAKELLSERFEKDTNYSMKPFYALVENGVFYHFLPIIAYKGIPEAYFRKNTLEDFKRFIEKNNQELLECEEFFKQEHESPMEAIEKLHEYMSHLFAIVMVSAYAPEYLENLERETKKLCIKTRERYENIHRDGMTLERELLNVIEKKLDIEKDSLEYLSKEELVCFVNLGKLPKGYLGRKEFFFVEYSKNKTEIFPREKAIKILGEIDKMRNVEHDVDEIKGNTACLGKVRGKVRIIKLIKEAETFNQGEVLVTAMTDPRYLSIMKKAAAIVTDEGGITCHAAIVARELKIPCVIGTKIATQVLHDGDLVEVDANSGVVRIVEKKLK